ncbi:MAG TPA: hypothetical protein VNT52_03695 [Acidimicrobiales bacterium]|nr:hypothetical protein [Acidimicrobiales bacterium]
MSERGCGFRLSDQKSDDLSRFLTRPVTFAEGVMAGVAYTVRIRVRLASDAPSGCAGIGCPRGEANPSVVSPRTRSPPGRGTALVVVAASAEAVGVSGTADV